MKALVLTFLFLTSLISDLSRADDRVRIGMFGTTWCGYCQEFHPIFDKAKANYAKKYALVYFDAEEEVQAASNFGVTAYPTLIVRKKNKKTGKWKTVEKREGGFDSYSEFVSWFTQY